ncbi:MAG: DNA-binding protein [Sphingobacteriales bacterium 50-39]|nr:helix-turn-helix domain-containing protein [Sphingobacteriales bacterium]OJW52868.1 MAG: DNA-binding protein [Sphingobacteriales bacterium 50-39]
MQVEFITKEDLEIFRMRLLEDIGSLLTKERPATNKPWLRGGEVRKLLSISASSLQTLRISGKLKSSKVGGIHYYRYQDIQDMMSRDNK